MKMLYALLALVPAVALAGPFDGTWKTRLDATQFSAKPQVFSVSKGMYDCASCAPKVSIKADGADQPVTGHAYFDTISVKAINDASLRIVYKKAGKLMYENTYSVSADHNTLTARTSDQSGTVPVSSEMVFKRGTGQASTGPVGSHATSGTWQYDSIKSMSDAGGVVTYTETADGLKMSSPTGQSYEAKFDGKEVPIQGDAAQTTVSLKRNGPREIEETDRQNGKVSDIVQIRVSADGKKMVMADHDVPHDRTDMYVLDKQP